MSCIFCRIVAGEIPSKKVYEDEDILAFNDISPARPVHILVIPKKHIESLAHVTEADPPVLGSFSLTDADGKAYTEDRLRGRWTFLFFGFTHCPDVCPGTLAVLKQVTGRLQDHPAFREQGQVLFVSVDPARDTPAVLGPYVRYFDPGFQAATAAEDALSGLTRQLGVIFAKVPGTGEDYAMDHSASIFIVDPQLRVLSAIGLPHDAARIAERFRAIAAFVDSGS